MTNFQHLGPHQNVRVSFASRDIESTKFGQPALFLDPDRIILETPSRFLNAEYVSSSRSSSRNTWAAAAYALQSWFDFLIATENYNWMNIEWANLVEYKDAYTLAVSPRTGCQYDGKTIADRLYVIYKFYQYIRLNSAHKDMLRSSFANELSHRNAQMPKRGSRKSLSDLLPRKTRYSTAIRPYMLRDLQAVLAATGPRASERRPTDPGSARDRLVHDLGWSVGLRLSELTQLTRWQFEHKFATDFDGTEHAFTILGKGSKLRSVAIPNWLVKDVQAYIKGERNRAIEARSNSSLKETGRLLVAGLDSAAPGQPISERRVQQIVEEACFKAGVTEFKTITDAETGAKKQCVVARHSIHDLRHTYAVLTYWTEIDIHRNKEPWKKIQAQLGHENLQTTIDTYLKFVEIFSARSKTSILDLVFQR